MSQQRFQNVCKNRLLCNIFLTTTSKKNKNKKMRIKGAVSGLVISLKI